MLRELHASFRARFGRPAAFAARAPGRINLIGEHTDYNAGLVLPLAIDRDTRVLAAPRGDSRFRVFSRERGELCRFDASSPRRTGGWVDYVQGVVAALRERGAAVPGCDLAVASELPAEAGLSSSAALSLAVATVLDAAADLGLDARARAEVAHRGESQFVGVGCGVMDPLACALGRRDHALRIDCRSLEVALVPLPERAARLLVADSGVARRLAPGAGAGYAERREECRGALEAARAAGVAAPDAEALRDLGPGDLPALEAALAPRLFRRARHVIRENRRVDAMVAALAAGDLTAAGALLREGMASLRDDFEVSAPELDALCDLADAQPGVYGSRLTGAGFGGCTLHLVAPAAADAAARALSEGFAVRFGRRPRIFPARAAAGAEALALPAA